MTKWTARDLAACSMCVALLTVCSWISVPLVIPFTQQTFAVCLAGALFGIRVSLGAVAGYILLGAAGVPVFSDRRIYPRFPFHRAGSFPGGSPFRPEASGPSPFHGGRRGSLLCFRHPLVCLCLFPFREPGRHRHSPGLVRAALSGAGRDQNRPGRGAHPAPASAGRPVQRVFRAAREE